MYFIHLFTNVYKNYVDIAFSFAWLELFEKNKEDKDSLDVVQWKTMVLNESVNNWSGKVTETIPAFRANAAYNIPVYLPSESIFLSVSLFLSFFSSLDLFFLSSKRVIKSIIAAINIKLLFSLSFLCVKLFCTVNGLVIDSRRQRKHLLRGWAMRRDSAPRK